MLLKICDLVNTFCQACLFVWVCNNITNKENKISKSKIIILIALIFSETVTLTYSDINVPVTNFIIVVIILILCLLFYRKYILDAFIGVGLAYFIISVHAYFLMLCYQNFWMKINLKFSPEIRMFLFVYIPIWISYYVIYKFRKAIFNTAIFFKNIRYSMIFILIIDYALIFVDTLRVEWTSSEMGGIFKSVLYLIAFVIFVFSVIYFAKINDKSKEVEMLNKALNEKITELKKVKHDAESEMSGLYGLYQLGKIDSIGILLKSIVDKNQAVNTAVNVTVEAAPMVASVIQPALNKGIDVIVFDSASYEDLRLDDSDLLRLISNIIRNSIDVLQQVENPIIEYRSYNSYNGINIVIQNNGPEISREHREKIFRAGFTTKENKSEDRGFGLSIVKDIINKCNGEIKVESNKNWTQFMIEIPYKVR